MSLLGLYLAEDVNLLDRSVLTDAELDGVIGEAGELDPTDPQRQQFVSRVNKGAKNKQAVIPTDDLRIRAAYSIRAHMLPDHIRKAIAANAIKIVNNAFYRIFDFSGLKQNDLMLNADTKLSGITNVNSRKLEENNFFLLTSIILQTGTFTDKPWDAVFGLPCREVLNGEFSLKNGDKVLVQPSSARIFDTTTRNSVIRGEWRLDNPKFIAPQVEIIPELKLPVAVPAKTAIKLILVGAGLVKA
jgi:hypothetical protein